MTRDQAQFIADRVPGAEAVGPLSCMVVEVVVCRGLVLTLDIQRGGIGLSTGLPNFTIVSSATQIDSTIQSLESALADARAAGILPTGKDGG